MTLSFLITIIGLVLWLLFTKWNKLADGWIAEFGKLCFFCGLLSYLLAVGSKVLF